MSFSGQEPASIRTSLLIRLIVLLIAVWSLFAGLALTAFHGAGSGALGAGVADEAGQRLAGAHLLVLAPVYIVIAWKPERYGRLLWLPFFAQAAVVLAVGYNILVGDTDFSDGVLAVAISGMLAVSLGFVWVSQQRSAAGDKVAADERRDEARRLAGPDDLDQS